MVAISLAHKISYLKSSRRHPDMSTLKCFSLRRTAVWVYVYVSYSDQLHTWPRLLLWGPTPYCESGDRPRMNWWNLDAATGTSSTAEWLTEVPNQPSDSTGMRSHPETKLYRFYRNYNRDWRLPAAGRQRGSQDCRPGRRPVKKDGFMEGRTSWLGAQVSDVLPPPNWAAGTPTDILDSASPPWLHPPPAHTNTHINTTLPHEQKKIQLHAVTYLTFRHHQNKTWTWNQRSRIRIWAELRVLIWAGFRTVVMVWVLWVCSENWKQTSGYYVCSPGPDAGTFFLFSWLLGLFICSHDWQARATHRSRPPKTTYVYRAEMSPDGPVIV